MRAARLVAIDATDAVVADDAHEAGFLAARDGFDLAAEACQQRHVDGAGDVDHHRQPRHPSGAAAPRFPWHASASEAALVGDV